MDTNSALTQGTPGSTPGTLGVVFVHGMRSSHEIWDEQVAHVRTLGHEAVAVDLPAHGTRHTERFTLERSFEVLDEAAASFGPDRPVVVTGLSLGGYTSLAWAARRPANLVGVLAAACTSEPKGKPVGLYRDLAHSVVSGYTGTRAFTGRTMRQLGQRFPGLGGPRILGRRSAPGLSASLPPGRRSVPGGIEAAELAIPKPSWDIVTDALGQLAGRSWLNLVREIEVPIWLVNGARDHMRLDEQRFLRAARDAALVVVPGAGHDVNLHAPAAFNRVLTRALTEFDGATISA